MPSGVTIKDLIDFQDLMGFTATAELGDFQGRLDFGDWTAFSENFGTG
jgi:hypothetical protein